MNKGIILAIIVGLLAGVGFWVSSRPAETPASTSQATASQSATTQTKQATELDATEESLPQNTQQVAPKELIAEDDFDEIEEEIKPANQVYSSAAEAIEAVKAGAERYDDIVLEQFAGLKDCAWCAEFYTGLKELIQADSSNEDLKSYTAEILAISGSVENVEFLFDTMEKNAGTDAANVFAESIELTFGDEKLVNYLVQKSGSDNALVQEAAVAALTNHGSPSAFEAIYQATIKSNDPNGFYDKGLGIGEMILDEESLPLAADAARKFDQHSHLAVKALLNNGMGGLKLVHEIIGTADEQTVEKLLDGAVDHVAYEDEVKSYANSALPNAKTAAEKKFWQELLEEISLSEQEELLDAEEEEEEAE